MNVVDLMTRSVVAVHPDETLANVASIMLAQHVSGLPVTDKDGHLVGVVTEGDLLCRTELGTAGKPPSWLMTFLMPGHLAADYVRTHGCRVAEVMTPNPVVVAPETDLSEAAQLMRDKRLKRLPVLQDGRLVGVISRSDMLKALAPKLAKAAGDTSEAAIRTHIIDALSKEKWAPKAGIRIQVTGDIVDLEGVIFSEYEREAIKVVAENAPGVNQVRDHLLYVDPASGMTFPVAEMTS